MLRFITIFAAAIFFFFPGLSNAEPIKLKLSFFTSDRSNIYRFSIKPFVDAVNSDGEGLVHIDVYFSGAISGVQSQQPQLVADGGADLAIVVPGQSPERFTDNAVLELPGIYRNAEEASRVYNRLIEAKAINGYGDYFVAGAFVSRSENIHSRKPIRSLDDLKALVIRANNRIESEVLEKLGATPVLIPINQTTEAMSRDKIDAATFPPSMLFEFGIGRVTSNHFLLNLGGAPTALVMNRKVFERLPERAQQIIRKYSKDWLSDRSAAEFDRLDRKVIEDLLADHRRKVVNMSAADLVRVNSVFDSVVHEWVASNPRNGALLKTVRDVLGQLRQGE